MWTFTAITSHGDGDTWESSGGFWSNTQTLTPSETLTDLGRTRPGNSRLFLFSTLGWRQSCILTPSFFILRLSFTELPRLDSDLKSFCCQPARVLWLQACTTVPGLQQPWGCWAFQMTLLYPTLETSMFGRYPPTQWFQPCLHIEITWEF